MYRTAAIGFVSAITLALCVSSAAIAAHSGGGMGGHGPGGSVGGMSHSFGGSPGGTMSHSFSGSPGGMMSHSFGPAGPSFSATAPPPPMR